VIAAATVFGGTMAPLIAETLHQGALSVGPPYFRPTFLLPALPLLALLAMGIHANWKRGRLGDSRRMLLVSLAIALACGLAVVFGAFADRSVLALAGIALGAWIILSSSVDPIERWRRGLSLSRAVLGMTAAHIGLGVVVIGLTVVESYTVERDIALGTNGSAQVGAYEFRLLGTRPVEGPNYSAVRAEVVVSRDGHRLVTLYPEKRQYWVRRQVGTVAGIKNRYGSDIFIALGDDLGAGRWSLRAQIRPMILLLWLGPILMALGGFVALSDRRYRAASASAAARVPLAAAAKEPAA